MRARGAPDSTDTDRAESQAWKRERKNVNQRNRRATNRRIDYYAPAADACCVADRNVATE
jgi:hypothetical protein